MTNLGVHGIFQVFIQMADDARKVWLQVMEDGDSPLIGLFVFLLLLAMDMVIHGFMAAMDNLNDSHLEKEVQEGNRKALWLAKVKEGSVRIFPGLSSLTTFISVAAGIYQSRMYGKMLAKAVLNEAHPIWMYGLCYVLIAIVTVFLLVALGILAPEKIAARKGPFSWQASCAF